MKYFSENKEFINAECDVCNRILKLSRKMLNKTQTGYNIEPSVTCLCGQAQTEIAGDLETKAAEQREINKIKEENQKKIINRNKLGCSFVVAFILLFVLYGWYSDRAKEIRGKELYGQVIQAYETQDYVTAQERANQYLREYSELYDANRVRSVISEIQTKEKREKEAKEKAEKEKGASLKVEIFKNMSNDFNIVQSQNAYSSIFSSAYFDGLKLVVYVTGVWDRLTEGEKISYVEQNAQLWYGMAGARGYKVDSSFIIRFNREGSNRLVARWNQSRGVSLE